MIALALALQYGSTRYHSTPLPTQFGQQQCKKKYGAGAAPLLCSFVFIFCNNTILLSQNTFVFVRLLHTCHHYSNPTLFTYLFQGNMEIARQETRRMDSGVTFRIANRTTGSANASNASTDYQAAERTSNGRYALKMAPA